MRGKAAHGDGRRWSLRPALAMPRSFMPKRISRADLTKIAALLATAAIMLLANGLQGTLVPMRGHLEGFSDTALSLQGFTYFFGFVADVLPAPFWLRASATCAPLRF